MNLYNIKLQRIDNIPRSIIQYIYSLFSKGSAVFMVSINFNK